MAELTKKDVLHVSQLAHLTLSDSEVEKFRKQLSSITNFVEMLSEVDTTSIDMTTHSVEATNVMRDDKIDVVDNLPVEAAISGKDDTYNNYFVVPAVLNKSED